MSVTQMPLRLPADLATKVRMISAANNVPMNTYITSVLTDHVVQWEQMHGALPTLPQEEQ